MEIMIIVVLVSAILGLAIGIVFGRKAVKK